MNTCPYCKNHVHSAIVEEIPIQPAGVAGRWAGASYGCPHCKRVLSIQVNPYAIQDEVISLLQTATINVAQNQGVTIRQKLVDIQERLERLEQKLK